MDLRDALTRAAARCEVHMTVLLDVKDLKTRFHTPEGTVYAVNGVSFKLDEGGTLAVVGESGCGKSVTMMSLLRLIPIPPGEIVSGSAHYHDKDLLKLSENDMQSDIRGKEIAMVFQDPMTSLNPVLTIGRQLTEPCVSILNSSLNRPESEPSNYLNWLAFRTQLNAWGIIHTNFPAGCANG